MGSKQMQKRNLSLAQKAKLLKKFGFDVKQSKKLKSTDKAKITKAWKKVEYYYSNEKQRFAWLSANDKLRKELKKGLGGKVITPKGYFIKVPKGLTKVPKYHLDSEGVIWYYAKSKRGKKVVEEIHGISPEMLAEDPPKAINNITRAAKKRGSKIVLTVNGFDSVRTSEYSIDALSYYVAHMLLPKFLDPNVADRMDEEDGLPKGTYNSLHNKRRKKKTVEDFCDTFHIKISHYVQKSKKAKK